MKPGENPPVGTRPVNYNIATLKPSSEKKVKGEATQPSWLACSCPIIEGDPNNPPQTIPGFTAKEYLLKIDQKIDQEEQQNALRLAKEASLYHPENLDISKKLVLLLTRSPQLLKAYELVSSLIKKHPQNLELQYLRIQILRVHGKEKLFHFHDKKISFQEEYSNLISKLKAVIKGDRADPETFIILSELLLLEDRNQEAKNILLNGLKKHDDDISLNFNAGTYYFYYENNISDAEPYIRFAYMKAAIPTDINDCAQVLILIARRLRSATCSREGSKMLLQFILKRQSSLSTDNRYLARKTLAENLLLSGKKGASLKMRVQIEKTLRKETEANPANSQAFLHLFDHLIGAGKTIEALTILENGLKHNPQSKSILLNLAGLYYFLENYGRAEELLTKGICIFPEDARITLELKKAIYAQGGARNFKRADDILQMLRQKLKIKNGTSFNHNYLMGRIDQEKGDYAKAVAYYAKALTIEPESTETLLAQAKCLLALSKRKAAWKYALKAYHLNPDLDTASTLYNICFLEKDFGENPKYWEQMFKMVDKIRTSLVETTKILYPDSWVTNLYLFQHYFYNREYLKAEEPLNNILGTLPKNIKTPPSLKQEQLKLKYFLSIARSPGFTGNGFELDGTPVKTVAYKDFNPGSSSPVIEIKDEMKIFLSNGSSNDPLYYYLKDKNAFNRKIKNSAAKLGCKNIKKLPGKKALMLAARITMSMLRYYDKTDIVDQVHLPLEERTKSQKGVCRNYITLFKSVFESLKEQNSNLKNLYVGAISNFNHTWNIIFEVKESRITATHIDITSADDAGRLDALDAKHFNPKSQDQDPESSNPYFEHAKDLFANNHLRKGLKYLDQWLAKTSDWKRNVIRLAQAELLLSHDIHKQAKQRLKDFDPKDCSEEYLKTYHYLLGVVAYREKRIDQALSHFEMAGNNFERINTIATVAFGDKKYETALKFLGKVDPQFLNPKQQWEYFFLVAFCQNELGNDKQTTKVLQLAAKSLFANMKDSSEHNAYLFMLDRLLAHNHDQLARKFLGSFPQTYRSALTTDLINQYLSNYLPHKKAGQLTEAGEVLWMAVITAQLNYPEMAPLSAHAHAYAYLVNHCRSYGFNKLAEEILGSLSSLEREAYEKVLSLQNN